MTYIHLWDQIYMFTMGLVLLMPEVPTWHSHYNVVVLFNEVIYVWDLYKWHVWSL